MNPWIYQLPFSTVGFRQMCYNPDTDTTTLGGPSMRIPAMEKCVIVADHRKNKRSLVKFENTYKDGDVFYAWVDSPSLTRWFNQKRKDL